MLDAEEDQVVRVEPDTGLVSTMFIGFSIPNTGETLLRGWAGVDIAPDGSRVFVTDAVADRIYTFSRVPLQPMPGVSGPGLALMLAMLLGLFLLRIKRHGTPRAGFSDSFDLAADRAT